MKNKKPVNLIYNNLMHSLLPQKQAIAIHKGYYKTICVEGR